MNEIVSTGVESDDEGPESALMALQPHLRQYVELRENEGLSQEQCVETIRPGVYANAKDAGWRWEHRPDVQAAIAELRAEAVKRAIGRAAEVIDDIKEIGDRCMQRVQPVLDRRGRHVRVETPDGEQVLAYVFDAANALASRKLLANILGLEKQRTEITGKDGGPIETANQNLNVSVPDDPVEASRVYMEMIQGQQKGK